MLPLEHSAILSTFIKLPFLFKIFVLSFFEWPLKTGFTVFFFLSQLYKSHCKDEPKLGHVLVLCGYFGGKGMLEEAKTIFDKTGDQQGLAQVLYMLGEKNQYNNDMSKSSTS